MDKHFGSIEWNGMKLLATYIAEGGCNFQIYGKSFEIKKEIDSEGVEYSYPVFQDLEIYIVTGNDTLILDTADQERCHLEINKLISLATMNQSAEKILYLDPQLKEVVQSFADDTVEIEGKKFPKRILSFFQVAYNLTFCTDKYLFYAYFDDCEFDMAYFDFSTFELLTNDIRDTEEEYWDAVDAVENGEQRLLWGYMPT